MKAVALSILPRRDFPLWDEFVDRHPLGWLYQSSQWRNVIESSFPHIKGNFLVLRDIHTQELRAGLPIYAVKSWMTGNRLVSIPLATLCDPLVSGHDDAKLLLDAVPPLLRTAKARYARIGTLMSSPLFAESGFAVKHDYKHHYLDLQAELADLRGHLHPSSIRRRIARARKTPLRLEHAQTDADMASFYRILSQTRTRLGLPPFPFRFIRAIWQQFYPQGKVDILFAVHEGKRVATRMLLKHKHLVSIEFSADLSEFRHFGTNPFLDWYAIKEAHREGYRVFSFGRTSSRNAGLLQYKDRWGTDVMDVSEFFYPFQHVIPNRTAEDSFQYRMLNGFIPRLPLPISRILGEYVYRHMG